MADSMPELILHVDDKETNRYIVRRVLESAGYRVHEAASGREALDRLQEECPELIILDVRLPDINGLELCRRIRINPETAATPILQMSAHFTGPEARTRSLDSGADAYLPTSAEPAEVVATVRALLRIRDAEKLAQAYAREWKATVDSVRDGILILDEHGVITRLNRAAELLLGGNGKHDHVGQRIDQVLSGHLSPVLGALGNGVPSSAQQTMAPVEFSEGTQWYRASVDPVMNEHGQQTGYVCVLSDFTGDRRAEEEIRRMNDELISARDEAVRANRAKSAFLASMSHELRTPLNIMLGYCQLLQENVQDHGHTVYLPDLQRIEQSGHHLVHLVGSILDLSRIEAGRMDLHLDSLDVETMMNELGETIQPLVHQRGNELHVATQGHVGSMWSDPAKLRQVLLNLLSNACKFTAQGQIQLTASRVVVDYNDWVVFRVSDTGIGILPEDVPKLFDEYSQFARAEEDRKGTGLGLAISRRFTEMMGGRIEVHSISGEGTTFTVTLPAKIG